MGIQPWDPKYYQKKIVDLEGRFYWDRKYENYQVVLEEENDGEGVVFPFHLRLHDSQPGLLAFVETSLPTQEGYREDYDRFQRLNPGHHVTADDVAEAVRTVGNVAEKPEDGGGCSE